MKHKYLSKPLVVWAIAAVCCALWGSAFPMIKVGYSLLQIGDTASIMLFAGIRFFLAGVLTIAIFSVVERRLLVPSRRSLPKIAVLSAFQTVIQYVFFYLGLAYTTGQKASIINGSACIFAVVLPCFVFRTERPTWRKLLACVICFVGVVLSNLTSASVASFSFNIGDAFIIVSALSYSLSSVFMKRYSADEDPYMLSGYQFMLGGAVMTAVGLLMGGRIDFALVKGVVVMLYLACVSAIAYSLWGLLLKYNPVSRLAVCGSMTTVFGYFLSLAIFGGTGVGMNLVALVLVVTGIVIMNINSRAGDEKCK